jgi:hypothetical protein
MSRVCLWLQVVIIALLVVLTVTPPNATAFPRGSAGRISHSPSNSATQTAGTKTSVVRKTWNWYRYGRTDRPKPPEPLNPQVTADAPQIYEEFLRERQPETYEKFELLDRYPIGEVDQLVDQIIRGKLLNLPNKDRSLTTREVLLNDILEKQWLSKLDLASLYFVSRTEYTDGLDKLKQLNKELNNLNAKLKDHETVRVATSNNQTSLMSIPALPALQLLDRFRLSPQKPANTSNPTMEEKPAMEEILSIRQLESQITDKANQTYRAYLYMRNYGRLWEDAKARYSDWDKKASELQTAKYLFEDYEQEIQKYNQKMQAADSQFIRKLVLTAFVGVGISGVSTAIALPLVF